ncbi:MAG: DUF2283 domain-containing protein [Desulfurococcales archaeon]|nr:DUF2283 domain-containing protein [Desulfurococcales archaeon]
MAGEGEERAREFEESIERARRVVVEDIDKLWIEYDKHNDILYINFGLQDADESIMVDDDIIVRLREGKLVGIVVSEFSKKAGIDVF